MIAENDEPLSMEPSPYVPKLPFPSRERQIQKPKEYARFDKIMKQLYIRLPFLQLVLHVPSYRSYLKDILSNRRSIEEGVKLISKGEKYAHLVESQRQQEEAQLTNVVEVLTGKEMDNT